MSDSTPVDVEPWVHGRTATSTRTARPWNLGTATASAQALATALPVLDLFERLAAIRAHLPGRIVFTTSFGLEDQAIAHAIFSQELAIEVATLDTGRLFPETHEVWAETEQRYGCRVAAFAPSHRSLARTGRSGVAPSV